MPEGSGDVLKAFVRDDCKLESQMEKMFGIKIDIFEFNLDGIDFSYYKNDKFFLILKFLSIIFE